MASYIVKRLLLMIPTLLGMSLILFMIVRMAPGVANAGGENQFGQMNGKKVDAKASENAVKRRLGMIDDEGNPISPPLQYFHWLGDTVGFKGAGFQRHFPFVHVEWGAPDLGKSIKYNTAVTELIQERLPVTLTMNLISSFIIYTIAISGGMAAAAKRGKSFDILWNLLTVALWSLPTIWVGGMAIGIFANGQLRGHFGLPWFPSTGLHQTDLQYFSFLQWLGDYLHHVTLPIIVMSYGGFAYLSKQMRASMLDNLYQDYARTARAKGLSESLVVGRHVLRNSLIPMITIFAGILPGMLAGSVIIERIFSIKGMGDLMYTAATGRDLPVIQAVSLVGSILALISLLLADLCYAAVDPRVSYD